MRCCLQRLPLFGACSQKMAASKLRLSRKLTLHADLLQAQPQSGEEGPELEVSPPMSRRTLELLVYLARHQPRLAREIPFQLVPGPPTEQTPVVEV